MLPKLSKFRVGPRTIKTAAAVIISILIVDSYGATTSKVIFAMLGAMAAVQPTFKESLESCVSQILGVLFGAIAGVLLLALPLPPLAAAGIGIVLVIALYNMLRIRFSPSLACLIVVTVCTTPDIQPMTYALGRIWDTAIGLGVGMLINMLIFPYDNSRRIRSTVESLDHELIVFLEDMFDGDDVLPDPARMERTIDDIAQQLNIFSNQKLLTRINRQKQELAQFRLCQGKARELLAQMEVLSRMDTPGRLTKDNRADLESCGAAIRDNRIIDTPTEEDIITNYHVAQLLKLRRELLNALGK